MARFLLSKTFFASRRLTAPSMAATQFRRARSTFSGHGGIIELDLSSSPSSSDGESEALMIKRLDDVVQRIIVQRATPDWLPFLPGSSFWVPPRRNSLKFTDLVDKLHDQLGDEESLSLPSDRGWPCTEFLVERKGSVSGHTSEINAEGSSDEVEMEVEVVGDSEDLRPFADKKG
ncbi:hypothetical protein PanWU01x14_053630 [Parasponia andersonii]|uniref:Uncharacterized protein n=1 Tax=Parasponia andersonii TaxID=3476 RepID=A0A2P5DLJ4_PARAD|nr:hypothetical protein PanWU01x14_053630 [Parasponia andersonii]